MCRSMADIQSATAEIRRGKDRNKIEETTGQNIMSASATQGGHKKSQTALKNRTLRSSLRAVRQKSYVPGAAEMSR